jgi:hypothetical protein
VLPATLRESSGGAALDDLYEGILRFLSPFDADRVAKAVDGITRVILPAAVEAVASNLQEAPLFIQGLALVPQRDPADGRCDN